MFDSPNKPPSLNSEVYVKQDSTKLSRFWIWIIVGVCVALLILLGIMYWRSQTQLNEVKVQLHNGNADLGTQLRLENAQLIDQVGKLIILPTDEQPTIATVTDLNKLKSQPFFAKAEVRDKVLIYSKARKAILYRPRSNQIIELAPLIDGTDTPAAPAATPTATPAQ